MLLYCIFSRHSAFAADASERDQSWLLTSSPTADFNSIVTAELAEKHPAAATPSACVLPQDQTGRFDFSRTRAVPLAVICNRRRNNGRPRGRPRRRCALCPRWALLMETPPSLLGTKGERQEEWMLTFFLSNGSALNSVGRWGETNKL